MKAIVNGRVVLPDRIQTGLALVYDDRIQGMVPPDDVPAGAEIVDALGCYVLPGLIDMHIHGYLGEDASDGNWEGIVRMAEGVAANGVTAFLPTTMTVSYAELERAFDQIRRAERESQTDAWKGAQVLGCNAEGPFINAVRKGAQAEENVRTADIDFLRRHADIIRVFTIAPEVPGNMECIRQAVKELPMRISMGHTDASYDVAKEAIEAGVRHVTHLFNAQTGLKHRDPGVVGAALTDDRVTTELIADTFHVHPALFSLVTRAKGANTVLITDCTRAGGLADGEYTLGGQPIFVHGIECRLADGTIAGSVLKLNEAVRNVLRHTSLPVWEAVGLASATPAKCIGCFDRKGSLEVGKDADIAIADDEMNIQVTIVRGKTIYRRER